jgi:hypothetical protein
MVSKISTGHSKHSEGRVHELVNKHSIEDPNKPNMKRERFLALLKSRYGYTNEGAVDELTRLLKQFYSMNKSVGIHPAHPPIKPPQVG